jgi:hypothetical protein
VAHPLGLLLAHDVPIDLHFLDVQLREPLGPVGAALVGAISVVSLRRHLILAERLFNGAMYAVSGYAAGSAYVALDGPVGRLLPRHSPWVIWPFAVAAAVHVISNQGLLWGALQLIRRDGRLPERVRVESSLPLLLASDLGFAVLGLLIAALWTVTYAFAAVLVLVPLFVARWAMGQFAEQQRAYSATMEALCQAVETKDLYTRGHSERVALLSRRLGVQLGLPQDDLRDIYLSGLLHDIGKIGVDDQILRKTGPLTREEFEVVGRDLQERFQLGVKDPEGAAAIHGQRPWLFQASCDRLFRTTRVDPNNGAAGIGHK